jgi:hypothetical protein
MIIDMTMKRHFIYIAALLMTASFAACGNKAENKNEATPAAEAVADKPVVYMTTDISPEGLVRVYDALGVVPTGRVAVKISTG